MSNDVKYLIKKNMVLVCILAVLIIVAVVLFVIQHDFSLEKIDYIKKAEEGYAVNPTWETKVYKDNEYIATTIPEGDLYQAYYRKYLQYMLYDQERAYEMLTENTKKNKFKTLDDYKKHANDITTIYTIQNRIENYSIEDELTHKVLTIKDTEKHIYKFYIYGIWNFEVEYIVQS